MVTRPLGRTGLLVSPIGFGTFKIGRNEKVRYANPYPLPTEKESAALLQGVLAAGCNYLDTAPAYGLAEERVGTALVDRRGEFVLSTKVGETFAAGASTYDFSPDAVRAGFAESLRRLRTDHVDVLFVHAPADDEPVARDRALIETLRDFKRSGSARFIGFSGKTVAAERRALEWADALMVEYHMNDRSHEPVIAEAASRGIGVVVKKGLASGALSAGSAIEFVLRNPGVASLVIGGLRLDHFRANVAAAGRVLKSDEAR